jgi:hypothetical protein
MSEAGIGRVLVASVHQAIVDILPDRLEFYENWLNPIGMRHGTIGLAPLNAVLSFLRLEGLAYGPVVELAGRYAAEWTVESQGKGRRALLAVAPRPIRVHAAMATARRTIRRSYGGSRAVVRMRRGRGRLDLRGSLFCSVRHSSPQPLCGFYASLVSRLLELHGVGAQVDIGQCRAVGDSACVLSVRVAGPAGPLAETRSDVD